VGLSIDVMARAARAPAGGWLDGDQQRAWLAYIRVLCCSEIGLRGLIWGYAARWYSLITPATTGFRRTDRRSATSRTGCASMSGGRWSRD
jgi:hypothetical protein